MRLLYCQRVRTPYLEGIRTQSSTVLKITLVRAAPGHGICYVALSHRWLGDPDEEVSFGDISPGEDIASKDTIRRKPGFAKILGACHQALLDGYEYVWVDTCCIDKSNSTELSEAINSMYQWYQRAEKCYAYLADVVAPPNWRQLDSSSSSDEQRLESLLRDSAWFKRGWTLQELIAPSEVILYDMKWVEIGSKRSWAALISSITSISPKILHDGFAAYDPSVAEKMSWAAGRKTEREEDRAYSLLGLFGIFMPVIYGEGTRAFTRLQHEIVKTTYDQSIFAWNATRATSLDIRGSTTGIFSETPDWFAGSQFHPIEYPEFAEAFAIKSPDQKPDYSVTNAGLHIQLPLFPVSEPGYDGVYYACIACTAKRGLSSHTQRAQDWPVIYLYRPPKSTSNSFNRVSFKGSMTGCIAIAGRDFKTQLLWVSSHERVVPLVWQAPDNSPDAISIDDRNAMAVDNMLSVLLTKRDLSIRILDAWTNGALVEENKLELLACPGTWTMKVKQASQVMFPPINCAVVARRISIADRLALEGPAYQRARSLSTMIIGSDDSNRKVLVVIAIGRGAWYVFLSTVSGSTTAKDCYQALLDPHSVMLSKFVGCGIPFSAQYPTTLNSDHYHVTVERGSFGQSHLTFRVIFGTGHVMNRSQIPIVCRQHVCTSLFANDIQVRRLILR